VILARYPLQYVEASPGSHEQKNSHNKLMPHQLSQLCRSAFFGTGTTLPSLQTALINSSNLSCSAEPPHNNSGRILVFPQPYISLTSIKIVVYQVTVLNVLLCGGWIFKANET